jgi:hypothetical protein
LFELATVKYLKDTAKKWFYSAEKLLHWVKKSPFVHLQIVIFVKLYLQHEPLVSLKIEALNRPLRAWFNKMKSFSNNDLGRVHTMYFWAVV